MIDMSLESGQVGMQTKVAIITGAGSGIGRACALRFSRAGCLVVVSDLNEKGAMDINLASVRWSLGVKFGLEFIRIGSRERARITKLVKTST